MKNMDLNASPLPDDDELIFKDHTVKESAQHKFRVTAPETMYQDREGRHAGSKRKSPYEEPMHHHGLQSSGSFNPYSLPPGWLDCPPCGSEIGYLIPSKVPLGEAFNNYVAPEKRYTPKQVIEQQMQAGRELGLVIDLTNTSRYYPESDWRQEGIGYIKIKCRGRDSVPEEEAVKRFVYEVLQFRSRETKANKYILVHCTHGHNRTGYMIVHFLIRNESLSVTEAIEKFAEARPPGIYKQDYIDALYKFFNERKPDQLVYPQTPEWKKSPDRDDDIAPLPNNNDLVRPLHNNLVRPQELMTSDDVLGEDVPYKQQEALRNFCYQVLKMNNKGRGKPQFPGSHPVSLSRDNLELLRQRYYYATWKADGTRYMMLILADACYLIDRNFNFRRVLLRFPCKNTKEGTPGKSHHYTLLDGEMIIDTEPSTRKQERRYLIYDLVAINQVSIIERPFSERWMILENEVIKPRNHERDLFYKSSSPYYRYDLEIFRVRRKDFYLLSAVEKLLKEFIPKLSHASDGLIFQGWDDGYVPRTHEGLLKWKYPEMNSVDFLFEMGRNNHGQLYLNERGRKKVMEGSRVIFQDTSDLYSYSGKIIECSWDSEERVWIFMRVRPDKSTPNEFVTYRKVMRSITDNITEEIVLNEIREILKLPLYTDRIRHDRRAFEKISQHRK